MAVGDGSAWDETTPVDGTLVSQVDDYVRDLRIGIRGRAAKEHEWPSSQSATSQAGVHKFVTLQNQAVKPTVSGTQVAAVYTKTSGSGLQELYWENEAGTEVQMTSRSSVKYPAGSVIQSVNTTTTAVFTITATMPDAPTTGDGTLLIQKAITPTATASTIEIDALVTGQVSADSIAMKMAAFYNTTAGAIQVVGADPRAGGYAFTTPLKWVMSPATTGACTIKLRCGPDQAGTYYANGNTAGTALYKTVLILREIQG